MNLQPWRSELIRLFSIFLIIPLAYFFTQSWQLAVIIIALIYIALLWRKMYLIHQWLSKGMPEQAMPKSRGYLGAIITLIERNKKSNEVSNKQQVALVKHFHDTLSAIPSATIILNKSSEIEWANYSALSLLGISGQRDVGIKLDNLLRQPSFVDYLQKDTGEQIKIQSPVSADVTLAVQMVKYADRRLLLAHNITPHIDVQRAHKLFIANASHELRTPLTVIAGYLEFIQSDLALPKSLQPPVKRAIEQSNQMEMLINDLLVLSKIESTELTDKHLTPINLKNHLTKTLQTIEVSKKTNDYKINSQVDDDKTVIQANEKELNSVCYNFINNAIKYSEPKSKITIKWECISKTQVKFSVTDEGIGIAPEHIAHLTERFYRVDSGRSRNAGGTGLGLSIVKHILERHHGHLEIHSTHGKGSTFSAIFPVNPLGN